MGSALIVEPLFGRLIGRLVGNLNTFLLEMTFTSYCQVILRRTGRRGRGAYGEQQCSLDTARTGGLRWFRLCEIKSQAEYREKQKAAAIAKKDKDKQDRWSTLHSTYHQIPLL